MLRGHHIYAKCDTPHSRPNVKNAVPKINSVARVLVNKLAKSTEGGKGRQVTIVYYNNNPVTVEVHCVCDSRAGSGKDASDMELMLKTLAYRTLAPVPVWKLLPDRQSNAATKRFDSLITGLIAQEKARLAAAGITDASTTDTTTTNGTDEVTDTSGVKGSCLLTQLVQYGAATETAAGTASSTANQDNKDSESSRYALTSKEIIGNAKLFFVAGTDTLGGSLTWLLYELGAHQDVQQKLRDEITAVMKGDCVQLIHAHTVAICSSSCRMHLRCLVQRLHSLLRTAYDGNCSVRCCCVDHGGVTIEKMPYADAVISESLRLHLPAPILGLTARKDVVVGGVTVPKGTSVFISQSKTAVSDDHFTNAKQFWPERWLIATGKQLAPLHTVSDDAKKPFVHDGKSLYLFGTGPRVCPGQQLALTNIKAQYSVTFPLRMCSSKSHANSCHYAITQVALATLLGSYNVSLKPDHLIPKGSSQFGYTPDAVHIILNKL
eukprot:1765-Heterococcus_DN1.PRE.4